jgi:transcriptional regulator with XRE-family HTH domain
MKYTETEDIKSGRHIGTRIKQRRKALELSQEKLAEALNVSYQQIQRYENGDNLLSTDKLQLVAKYLDVPIGYFFEKDQSEATKESAKYKPSDDAKFSRLFKKLNKRYKQSILLLTKLAAEKSANK